MFSLLLIMLLQPQSMLERYVDTAEGATWEMLAQSARQRKADLLAAQQAIEVARGRLKQAGARPNPSVSTEYTTQRLTTGEEEYDFAIEYSQPLEMGGKRSKRQRLARLELERAEREYAYREAQLTAQLRSSFAEALAAIESARLTEQQLHLNEQILRAIEARLSAGDASQLERNLLRAEHNRLKAQLVLAEARLKLSFAGLKALAGLEQTVPLRLRGSLQDYSFDFTATLEGLQEIALLHRQDLEGLRLAEEEAEARLELARAEAVPDLTIFGRYGQDNSVFEDTLIGKLTDPDKSLSFGVSVPLPLFNRNRGNIAAEASARVQARHLREAGAQQVAREVAEALARLEAAQASLKVYEQELLPVARENLHILRAAYELGEQQLLDVLSEQRRLLEAEQLYIEALKEKALAFIELERTTGARLR